MFREDLLGNRETVKQELLVPYTVWGKSRLTGVHIEGTTIVNK